MEGHTPPSAQLPSAISIVASVLLPLLLIAAPNIFDAGEVPDIQIKREDVMKPLLRLVLLDSSVAKGVTVQLVRSIGGDGNDWDDHVAPHLPPGDNLDMYKSKLKDQIVSALRHRATASADVVEALLGIAQCFAIHLPAKAGGKQKNFDISVSVQKLA